MLIKVIVLNVNFHFVPFSLMKKDPFIWLSVFKSVWTHLTAIIRNCVFTKDIIWYDFLYWSSNCWFVSETRCFLPSFLEETHIVQLTHSFSPLGLPHGGEILPGVVFHSKTKTIEVPFSYSCFIDMKTEMSQKFFCHRRVLGKIRINHHVWYSVIICTNALFCIDQSIWIKWQLCLSKLLLSMTIFISFNFI